MKSLVFTILFIVFASATPVFSQARATSIAQNVEAARTESAEIRNRSMQLERVVREANTPDAPPVENHLNFSAIREDFERIQIINAEALQFNVRKPQLDYKAISKGAAEVKKRAVRLKNNLFPADSKTESPKDDLKKVQDKLLTYDLKRLSIEVDNALYRFTSNNMFRNIQLMNLADTDKAKKELDKIVILCLAIEAKSKLAEKNS